MKLAAAACACLSLAGCNTITDWFPPSPPATVAQVPNTRNTAVILAVSGCPLYTFRGEQPPPTFKPTFIPLIATAIPFVVATVADAVKTAVSEAQSDLTATYIAYGIQATSPPQRGCLIIAKVTLGETQKDLPDHKGWLTTAWLRKFQWANYPSLYTEILVAPDYNRKAVMFEPVAVQFDDTAAPNPGWSGKKNIGIILSFARSPLSLPANPTPADLAKASISIPFSLGKMSRGTFRVTDPNCATSQHPPASQHCIDAFSDQMRSVLDSAFDTSNAGGEASLNTYALVTESNTPGFFDKIVLDAVSSSSFQTLLTTIASGLAGKSAKTQ